MRIPQFHISNGFQAGGALGAGMDMSPDSLEALLFQLAQMMSGAPGQMLSQGGLGGMMSGQMSPDFGGSGSSGAGGFSSGGGAGLSTPTSFSGTLPGSPSFLGGGNAQGVPRSVSSSYTSTDSYVPSGSDKVGSGVALGGSAQGHAAVDWARSQLGVSEAKNPGTVKGYSNGNWQAWCADFVSKSFSKTGGSPFGHQSSVAGILAWGKENGKFTSAKEAAKDPSKLQAGDIATWKSDGKSHVGLVTSVNKNGTFNTIEGNTGDKVAERTHGFGKGLTGFVRATEDVSKSAGTSKGSKAGKSSTSSGASKSAAASSGSKSSSSGGSKSSKT